MTETTPQPITPEDIPDNISPELLAQIKKAFTGSEVARLEDIPPENKDAFLNALYQVAARLRIKEHGYPGQLPEDVLQTLKNNPQEVSRIYRQTKKEKTLKLLPPEMRDQLEDTFWGFESIVLTSVLNVFLEDPEAAWELLALYVMLLNRLRWRLQTENSDSTRFTNGVRDLKKAIAVLNKRQPPKDTDTVGVDTSRLEQLKMEFNSEPIDIE